MKTPADDLKAFSVMTLLIVFAWLAAFGFGHVVNTAIAGPTHNQQPAGTNIASPEN